MPGINVAQICIAFIVLLFSLTVHDLAHAWTADRLGDPTGRRLGRGSLNPAVHADLIGTIVFPLLALAGGFPLVGWAKPVPVNAGRLRRLPRDFVLVALAGPLSSLALAVVAVVALRLAQGAGAGGGDLNLAAPLTSIAAAALGLNLLLAVFNLIPVPPLDGGNVLSGLLPRSPGDAFDRLRPYGFLLLYARMFAGALGRLITPPYRLLRSWPL